MYLFLIYIPTSSCPLRRMVAGPMWIFEANFIVIEAKSRISKQSRNSSSERQKMSNYSEIKSRIQMQDDEGNWRVPNEVLLHIASLVDDREGLKMSCKKFYSIVCSCDGARVMKINVDKVRMNAHAYTASLHHINDVYTFSVGEWGSVPVSHSFTKTNRPNVHRHDKVENIGSVLATQVCALQVWRDGEGADVGRLSIDKIRSCFSVEFHAQSGESHRVNLAHATSALWWL